MLPYGLSSSSRMSKLPAVAVYLSVLPPSDISWCVTTGASGGTGVSFSSPLCSSDLCSSPLFWSVLVAVDGVGLRLSWVRDSCATASGPCGNRMQNTIRAATAIPQQTKRRATFMSDTSSLGIAKTITAATRIQMRSVTNCKKTVAHERARCPAERVKMKILDVTPMLTVLSIDSAVEFYRDVLSFRCVTSTPGWACVALDGTEVMFALPNAHLAFQKPAMTGSLYFNSDDVDAWW